MVRALDKELPPNLVGAATASSWLKRAKAPRPGMACKWGICRVNILSCSSQLTNSS